MAYQRGDIVLVPFPFTDLSAAKTRPAVVVSIDAFEDALGAVTVAMVTSRSCDTPFDCPLRDWRHANLRFPSWVRPKLVTLDPSLVRYRPGRLSVRDLARVDQRLRLALGV
jgi:mRNA interferase MazF